MAYVPVTDQEIESSEPIKTTTLHKLANNFEDHEERIQLAESNSSSFPAIIMRVNGNYSTNGAVNDIVKTTVNLNISILGVRILIDKAGTSGSTEIDLKVSRSGGPFTSIFNGLLPSVAFGAGDNALSASGDLDNSQTLLQAGDIIRLDQTSVQVGGVSYLVRIDWARSVGVDNPPAIDPKFSDAYFEIFNQADTTKRAGVDLSNLTSHTTRTIFFADADVDLADVNTNKANITTLQGDVTTSQGDITTLQSDVTTLQSDLTALELIDLPDVNVTTPANGDTLSWDVVTSKWINLPGGATVSQVNGYVGNVELDSSDILLDKAIPANGTIEDAINSKAAADGIGAFTESIDSTSTGANVQLVVTTNKIILTDAGLVSIEGIQTKDAGSRILIVNKTGGPVDILDNAYVYDVMTDTALPITTGTGIDITMQDRSAIILNSNTTLEWMIIGGSGSGGAGTVQSVNSEVPDLFGDIALDASMIPRGASDVDADLTIVEGAVAGKEPSFSNLPISKGGTNSVAALVNNRVMKSVGGAIVEAAAITASRALASDVNGIPVASAASATELDYVAGLQGPIQDQLQDSIIPNFLNNSDAILSVSAAGWVKYNDAGASYADGTGGTSSNLTVTRNTTNPLFGISDLSIAKSAANAQGEGVSALTKTIGRGLQGKPIVVSFIVDATDANYVTGDMQYYLYDVTNSQIISVSSAQSQNISKGMYLVTGFAYPAYNCASIRLSFFTASVNALAYTIYADNFKINPAVNWQANAIVGNDTDWVSPTAPVIMNIGTQTTQIYKTRRQGPNLQMILKFSGSAYTANPIKIPLPPGLTADVSTNVVLNGTIGSSYTGGDVRGFAPIVLSADLTFIQVGKNNSTSVFTPVNSNYISNGNEFSITVEVPIKGWTATSPYLITNTDEFLNESMTFVQKTTALTGDEAPGTYNVYTGAANTSVVNTLTSSPTTQTDADKSVNGIRIFAKNYGSSSTAGNPARIDIAVGKNFKYKDIPGFQSTGYVGAFYDGNIPLGNTTGFCSTLRVYDPIKGILTLDAGWIASPSITTRYVGANNANTYTDGYFAIRASKKNAVTGVGLDKVIASYVTTSGASIAGNSEVIINYNTAVTDTQGLVTTGASWKFTSNKTATFRVNAGARLGSASWTGANYIYLSVFKNGTLYRRIFQRRMDVTGSFLDGGYFGTCLVPMIPGDYINVRLFKGPTSNLTVNADENYIDINEE